MKTQTETILVTSAELLKVLQEATTRVFTAVATACNGQPVPAIAAALSQLLRRDPSIGRAFNRIHSLPIDAQYSDEDWAEMGLTEANVDVSTFTTHKVGKA